MNKKYFIIAIFSFVLGIIVANNLRSNSTVNTQVLQQSSVPSPSQKPTSLPCGRDNRYIETMDVDDNELMKRVLNDKDLFKFVRDNCLWVFDSLKGNIVDKDKENIVLVVVPVGCGSCHAQTLSIFSNGKLISYKVLDDPKVQVLKRDGETDLIEIIEPLRSNEETLGMPTWGIKTIYKFSEKELFPISRVPIKY